MSTLRWDGAPIPHAWTEADIATLRALAGKMSVSEIAQRLARSEMATQRKMNLLGFTTRLPSTSDCPRTGWPWEQDELQMLRHLAKTYTRSETAIILGRTFRAVRAKAHELRITFQKRGPTHHAAKYPAETIRCIWELRQLGYGYGSIGKQVGISRGYVKNILTYGSRWSEIMRYDAEQEGASHD